MIILLVGVFVLLLAVSALIGACVIISGLNTLDR